MHRNLDRRVEALVRVTDPAQQADLSDLIDLAMDETTASWWLEPTAPGPGTTWTPPASPCATCSSICSPARAAGPLDG